MNKLALAWEFLCDHIRPERDKIAFDIGWLTIEFYWPMYKWQKKTKSINAKTVIVYHAEDWEKDGMYYPWKHAGAVAFLGFGIGIGWRCYASLKGRRYWKQWEAEQEAKRAKSEQM